MKSAFFRWRALRALGLSGMVGTAAMTAVVAVQGAPRTSIHPYLEVQQVLTADFNGGDVLTYTGVGGGINATVETRRVTATISYDYQHRIAWQGDLQDDDVHSGVAAIGIQIVPDMLTFEAGAMATRSSVDSRVPVPGFRTSNDANLAEVYSLYAGPTLSTKVGPLQVGAAYRLGYVAIDDHSLAGANLPTGAPRVDRYKSSMVHNASASVGMAPGELPVGWTLGAGYSREDTNRLDSTFEGKYVRGDVVVPVGATLAVTAGVGYETMKASQQDLLRDSTGFPVITASGDIVGDPSRPRLLTYDQSGLIWDAGVIWRPSPRTELQARVGQRYGGTTFTGSLKYQLNGSYALTASVYDSVDSFGRLLVTDVSGLPRKFTVPRNGLGGVGGCVFGTDPGTGSCFDDALQSINSFNFRNRGANVMLSGGRGPWTFGLGAGYSQRHYFAPSGPTFILNGVTDSSFNLQASASRRLTRSSGYDLDAYAGWYNSGIAGADNSFSSGVTGSYYRNILNDRLQANVAAGLYTTQAGNFDSSVGTILFGLKYGF